MVIRRYMNIKSALKGISNIPGWHTRRHFVVFESDDWGSLRMPSLKSFEKLEKLGIDLRSADAERYNLNDTLATEDDLSGLFEVLCKHIDSQGNTAVFTPVSIVANPNFEKIKESGFKEYFYEPITETFKRYKGCENAFELWKKGIDEKIFVPQMHGREHLNVSAWMNDLYYGDKSALLGFEESLWGFVPAKFPIVDYQAAFLLVQKDEIEYQKQVIKEGLQLFEKLFGYKAVFFVPPNGMLNNELNKVLKENGINYRYAAKIQNEPLGNGKYKTLFQFLGKEDKNGIKYIIRNAFFEPSQMQKDWLDSCMNEINSAFRWNKPAIIGTHRVNFVGGLNPKNRTQGLKQLDQLLTRIVKAWPDVEFVTTEQLGNIMNNNK